MKILKLKIILSVFVGIFLYISHMMIYREITADSDIPFISAIFFLLFLTLWTAVGTLLSPFKTSEKPHYLFSLFCLVPASLLSLTVIQLLTANYPVLNYTNLALVALAGCFPPGIIFGTMLVSARNSISSDLQKHLAFFSGMGYFVTGFIIYPMNLFNVLTNPYIYTLTGSGFILIIALAALKFKGAHSIKYWILTFAAIIIALNFMFLKLETYSTNNFFKTRFPDWNHAKSYLTHHGRVSLLMQKNKGFMLLRNTKKQETIPDDCLLYKTNIIPLTLQPDKTDLRILTIGSSFSFVPAILGSLPYVKDVTMLAAGRNSIPPTILRNFSFPPYPKVSIIDMSAIKYLKENKQKFDLIVWLLPDREFLNFDSIMRLCKARMNKDGALALPASLLAVNNGQNSCRKLFKNKISLPGKSLVYAFSNATLTANLNILEKRLDKLDTSEVKLFPPGTFSVIYSIPVKKTSANIPEANDKAENLLIKSFCSLKINLKNILIISAAACLYFILRFFLLRRKKLQTSTSLFENGLCLMLLMTVLTTLYAQSEGSFYYNFGTILAVISGVPVGIGLSQFKLRRLAVIMSIVVVCLASLHFWEYYSIFVPFIAYTSFLCGGIIIADIFKQNPDADIKLLCVHFLACALGAAIMFVLLIMHFNLLSSLIAIMLFRIPLIFSKTFLGKLDTSEVTNV